MNKRSKSILLLLIFCLLIQPIATAETRWETLNFAPVVDFELKDKKKVDVIVDVGNTSYTMEQINSMVNENLRPALTENGLDYNIHVEKSSEGATKLYYFLGSTLYEYDTVTKASRLIKQIPHATYSWARGKSLYDPTTNLIFKGTFITSPEDRFLDEFYPYIPRTDRASSSRTGTLYEKGFISETGFYFAEMDGRTTGYDEEVIIRSALPTHLIRTRLEADQTTIGRISAPYQSSPPYYRTSQYMEYFGDQALEIRVSDFNYETTYTYTLLKLYLNTNLSTAYEGNIGTLEGTRPSRNTESLTPSTYVNQVAYFKGTGEIIYVSNYPRSSSFKWINSYYNTFIYDPVTKQSRIFEDGSGNQQSDTTNSRSPKIITLNGNQLLYKPYADTNWYFYEDYRDESTKKLITSLPSSFTWQTNVGNYIVITDGTRRLLLFDPEGDKTHVIRTDIESSSYLSVAAYPRWYESEKRYITDILEEVPLRSDAEKYYIRIDDQPVPHLEQSKTATSVIKSMTEKSISFLTIGNSSSEVGTQRVQSALANTQHYDVGNIQASLEQAARYIAERKEADLHVLVAQSGQNQTAIQTSVQQIVQALKQDNIIVTPHIHVGSTSSKLQELYERIRWNEEKNQYVLFLNTAAMNELQDESYLEGAVSTLTTRYAHYIQIGSSSNRSIAESIITMNEGRGKFYSGTGYSTYYADMQKYIKDTALKSAKRVKDVLVLEHDPVTNEYSAEINVDLFYEDYEADRKRNERFKTTQDPTVYENHTGLMDGIGQYQEAPTTRFTKVGLYEMTMQAQDEPLADARFADYWKWSQDSASMLRLYVHRAPVALFSAVVRPNRSLVTTDYSYDLDRYSRLNRGINEWEWKYKKIDDASWTDGKLASLANNTDYLLSLRVKDLDGAWSKEYIQFVTSNPYNQPPVALFEIDPKSVSHRGNATIIDRSYDPDGDELIKREWIARKDGQTIWNQEVQPPKAQLQAAAASTGLNIIGNYQLSLRVTDALGEVSEWHTEWMEVVNYPPLANFADVVETDRDRINTLINTTIEPDADGDPVSYQWSLQFKNRNFGLGTAKNPNFRIRNYGLGKEAVGDWMITLRANDPLGASSTLTKPFTVINHPPIATITSSPPFGYIDETYSFTAHDTDADSEDVSSLKSYWRLTSPSGKIRLFYQKNLSGISFDEKGIHGMEHWAEDQLGAPSDVVKVNVNVLNRRPIADFVRTPITTYRGVEIDFQTRSTDLDGYIDSYYYELVLNGSPYLTLSRDPDFKRSFSSIGTFDVRHSVTDNDGASDSITKQIHIINRAPSVEVTQPSGTSAANATLFNTLTPMIRWLMTDPDNDKQVQYQLQLKAANGTLLRTTPMTTTVNPYYTLPAGWITEGNVYRVSVRVFDGYDWSPYSSDKYFYTVLNQPPEAGFTYAPQRLYEGDTVRVEHDVHDPDLDRLMVQYVLTNPNGSVRMLPATDESYQLTSDNYRSFAFQFHAVEPGSYSITQIVEDGLAAPVRLTKSFIVAPLSIVGQVTHAELWERYRQEHNARLPAGSDQWWDSDQFYSGESFMLSANTTLSGMSDESVTYAVEVIATLQTTGRSVTLEYEGGNEGANNGNHEGDQERNERWSGNMWHEDFADLAKGIHSFVFNVTYSNGVTKQHLVDIEIIGKAAHFVQVQRWK